MSMHEALTGQSRKQARDQRRKSQAARARASGERARTRSSQHPGPNPNPRKPPPPKYGTRSRTSLNINPNPRTDADKARNTRHAARHAVHVKNEPERYLPPPKEDADRRTQTRPSPKPRGPWSEKPPDKKKKEQKYGTRSRSPLNLIVNPQTDRERARNARKKARHAVHVKNEPERYLPPKKKKKKKSRFEEALTGGGNIYGDEK